MSSGSQAVYLNGVPLLALAAIYLAASIGVVPALWRERARMRETAYALAAIFPCLGGTALVVGAVVIDSREPIADPVPALAAIVLVAVPGLLYLVRWRERAGLLTRARAAAEEPPFRERELEAVASISGGLANATSADEIVRLLLDEVAGLFGVDVTTLTFVSAGGREAVGVLGRDRGRDLDWYPGIRLDLEREPSGIASAVFEAAPVSVYDCESSSITSPVLQQRTGVKSAAYVPLIADERVIGVLVAGSKTSRAFSGEELSVMQALAAEAAVAIEGTRSSAALAVSLERQRGLLEAARVLASELELESVLERLVTQVAGLVEADAADCYLLDPARGVLRCAAVHGLDPALVGFEFPADEGLSGEAIASGRTAISSDYGRHADGPLGPAYSGFSSAIVTPVGGSGGLRGVLGAGRRGKAQAFRAPDAEVLEAFASLASVALENAHAFAERSRQASVQRGFFRIASVLGEPLSLTETLGAIAQAATEALDGSFAAVLMPGHERLELTAAHELPSEIAAALAHGLPESASALGAAAEEGQIVAASSLADDDRFDADWRGLAGSAASLLAVPVASPIRGGGGLVVVFFADGREFTDEDLELARHLAHATRGALDRSELFEAERTSRALAQQLARTASLLATELDPAAVLDEVVQQAPALVGADACTIRVLEGEELVVEAAAGEGIEAVLGSRASATAWLSGDVVQSREPVAVEDAAADGRLLAADAMLAVGYRAFLGVPLAGPEGLLHGVLAVYARDRRAWTQAEIEALLALAGNTSAALSNAELYQRVALERERSVAILANIADGIVAVDREENVVLWNAAAEQITGVPAGEALGRTPVDVLRQPLGSEGDALTGDRLVPIRRGADEVWLSLTEAVMRDPAGVVAGRIFAFRDISADRFVEQMKSDFVATVSHELRTPLTSIYGFAETLLRSDVEFGERERQTFLGYIASEAGRLTAIVDALLNVARLDAGDLQVNLTPVDVRDVVSEVVTNAEADGLDGHRFVVELPEEPLSAKADPDKLRQILSQLVDNAVKYSPEGGTVTVAARRKLETVEVRVADQGIGIPRGEERRIFRKFYRGEGPPVVGAPGASGTGVGLFIAEGLVTAMGGRIWVDSAEGQGSSFGFELPLSRQAVLS